MIDSRLIGSERKRSITPSVMSCDGGDAGADDPERERLPDDPREQVVLVADPGTWIAEPNTYRNSRMNTIGWIVTSSRRSGTRGTARRLRTVSSAVSRMKRHRRRRAATGGPGRAAVAHAATSSVGIRRRSARRVLVRTWPVSARNASSSVGRRSAISSTPTPASRHRGGDARQVLGLVGRGHRDRALLGRGRDLELVAEQRDQALELGAVGRDHVDPLRPDLGLELGRRAGRDLAAAVDQHDAVGERVGLLEVLGRQQQRHALRDERADRRPHDLAAAGVEARGRLVEHEHVRGVDQAGGEVDAAALAARTGS